MVNGIKHLNDFLKLNGSAVLQGCLECFEGNFEGGCSESLCGEASRGMTTPKGWDLVLITRMAGPESRR